MANSEKPQKKQSVARSAAAMSLGTLSSRILGMVRDMVLAALFSRTVTDAYLVAFRLPNMFRRLLGEGALSVSFLPIYIDQLTPKEGEAEEAGKARAQKLADGIYSLLAWASSILTVLGILFMEPLLEMLVGGVGFRSIPGKVEHTVFLARIMFAYLFLVTQYAFLMSVMNAHKRFLMPALGPAFYNIVFIIFALLPKEWGRLEGETLAWGVIFGGIVQAGFVFIPLYKMGYLPHFKFRPWSDRVGRVLRNMVPGLIGMGILQLMGLANLNFASRLSEGSHTYVYFADRILELPQSIIGISLGAALLPTLSEYWAKRDKEKMLEVGQRHMRLLLFLALPSAVGMYVLAGPIVEVLFVRGKFTMEDAAVTAGIIKIYAVLLIFLGLHKVTVPSFYAIQNTWLPACTSAAALVFHIIMAPILMKPYGLEGMIYSTALAGLLNLTLLFVAYRVLIGPLGIFKLIWSGIYNTPALVAMGFVVYATYFGSLDFVQGMLGIVAGRAVMLFISVAMGIVVYFAVSLAVKQEETRPVIERLKKRFLKV